MACQLQFSVDLNQNVMFNLLDNELKRRHCDIQFGYDSYQIVQRNYISLDCH